MFVPKFSVQKNMEYRQERRRFVFIGNRLGLPVAFPNPTHGFGAHPFVTVKDAISDLPALENGEDKGVQQFENEPRSEFQREMRAGSNCVSNHSAAPVSPKINLERMHHIPQGGSWRDIPFDLLPEGMKRAKRSDHTKRYGRLNWDGVCFNHFDQCDPHWGAYFHPDQDRNTTVREAARLQSFPDWFEFKGSRTDEYVQVGNAVPPLLGRAIARTISKLSLGYEAPMLVAAE